MEPIACLTAELQALRNVLEREYGAAVRGGSFDPRKLPFVKTVSTDQPDVLELEQSLGKVASRGFLENTGAHDARVRFGVKRGNEDVWTDWFTLKADRVIDLSWFTARIEYKSAGSDTTTLQILAQ